MHSLKTAVGDAEERVGECLEQVRGGTEPQRAAGGRERGMGKNEAARWKWSCAMSRKKLSMGEREREDLEGQLDESEKRREAAEMMAQEAESKIAGMRAGSASSNDGKDNEKKELATTGGGEVEIAVEKVARELHILYKSKHETKVAALKKSYENRWDKKIKEPPVEARGAQQRKRRTQSRTRCDYEWRRAKIVDL